MITKRKLQITSLIKSYGKKKAVNRLSLSLSDGEIFALLGPNGAGKTTTLKMISGLIIPDSGTITLDDRSIDDVRKSIVYVPDEPTVFPNLSGREFVRYTARLRGIKSELISERLSLCSKVFEMDGWLDNRSGSYSHGMIQRVVLSSAFVAKPDLYIIDEPLVGLDPPAAATFWRMVEGAAVSGAIVLISTHSLSTAFIHCKKFGIIHKGELLHTFSKGELSGTDIEDLFFEVTGTSPAEVTSFFEIK